MKVKDQVKTIIFDFLGKVMEGYNAHTDFIIVKSDRLKRYGVFMICFMLKDEDDEYIDVEYVIAKIDLERVESIAKKIKELKEKGYKELNNPSILNKLGVLTQYIIEQVDKQKEKIILK